MSTTRTASLRELIDNHRSQIRAVVARHHGRTVRLFGSVLRGDDHVGSDVDLLVELDSSARPIEVLSIEVELSELLGVNVDVVTPQSLRSEIRDEILAEAVSL